MASALINVPPKAKRGDVIEIKTLMSHIMETGYRHTATGEVVPRDIITSFACRYNGVEIPMVVATMASNEIVVRSLVDRVLADPRLHALAGLPRGPHLQVGDPRTDVVKALPDRLTRVSITLVEPVVPAHGQETTASP